MRQKNIYFDKMMRLRQKQSKTMRLSDLEQTDVIKERRLRENRDSMEKPILKIQNLNLYFTQYARGLRRRELHPLRDLSCKLFSGELTAVVGASGSGKSLLAHAILGILPYNCRMEGKISYQGEVLDETRLAGLRGNGISLIPQGVSYLDPLMRVGDQICGGRKDEATRAKCRQLLKRYGLDESVEKCYPFELSGGMARRVLMAAALMQEPRLIVADEPTPGLEAMTARHVIRHLKEMAQDGAAVLLITHDMGVVSHMADRVLVMYAGQIVEIGMAEEIFRDAWHPYTWALLASMPDLETKEKLDAIYRARECIEDERIPGCFMQTVMLAGTIVALVSSFFVAGSWNVMIPVILVLFFLPEMLIRKKAVKAEQTEKEKTVTLEREKEDLWASFFRKEAAKEIKVFQTGNWLIELWREKSVHLLFREWRIKKTAIDRLMWAQLLRVAGLLACFGLLAAACLEQKILAGALAGALSLLPAIQEALSELGERSWNLQKSLPYTECYFNITEGSRKKKSAVLTLNDRIVGTDVVFTYDGEQGRNVLDGVSFEIRRGQKVALVGENGAGKTTLIKCLLGLYPLKSGSISYDKVLVSAERDCDYSNISVMPHEFGRYCLTVAENIGFDDADSVHPENFSLENWFLGKEYGGQELSGGQWQRVALYRCLHKDAEFYVLDEPTAYLDPSHEAEAVAEILEQLKDKTVLIITHRIGICRLMDQVIVMDKNHKIAGTGSHEELSQTCPVYQKLYESQAEWYR